MAIDINAIRARLGALENANKRKSNIKYFRPEVGEYNLRIVPWLDTPDDDPFKNLKLHYLVKPRLVSPASFGKPDLIIKLAQEIRADRSDPDGWKKARKLEPAEAWYAAVLDRAKESEGLMLWSFNLYTWKRLVSFFLEEETESWLDAKAGFDLKLKITPGKKMYNGKPVNETTIDLARKATPLSKDPALMKKYLDAMVQFSADFTADNQPATDSELQNALNTYLNEQEAASGIAPATDKTDSDTSSRGPSKSASNTSSAVDALDSAVDDLLNLLAPPADNVGMAASRKKEATALSVNDAVDGGIDAAATADFVKQINREMGDRVAFNLAEGDAPTNIKRWLPTGSILLDYMISNRPGGGLPEGRIIELSGMPSTGKSHIAYEIAKNVQKMGGLVVYIDTENATQIEKLHEMGLDVRNRFIYCDTHCTEEVFEIIEKTITKAKQVIAKKNVPFLVIWDSVASSSPKAELEGNYDKDTIGLQARVISKCMRKITGVLGENNVTLLCLNQLRTKIGEMFGDPMSSPGGNAIPFHSSVRLRLGSGQPVKNKKGEVVGIKVIVTLKKNKVAYPHRKCEFEIHFGRGISEAEQIFDVLREWCGESRGAQIGDAFVAVSGDGAWKELTVTTADGEVLVENKFYKHEFHQVMNDPKYSAYVSKLIEAALVIKPDLSTPQNNGSSSDSESEC